MKEKLSLVRIFWFGIILFAGLYGKAMCETELEWLMRMAEAGDKSCLSQLAYKYRMGEGVPRNAEKAIEFYEKAALQGDLTSQLRLAKMYSEGEGTSQNYSRAFKWYEKAAEQGDAYAQFITGRMCLDGQGTPRDYIQGGKWIILAKSNGETMADLYIDSLQSEMTPDQFEEAQQQAKNWQPVKD